VHKTSWEEKSRRPYCSKEIIEGAESDQLQEEVMEIMEFGRGKIVKRVTICCSGWHNCCSPGAHQPASGDEKSFKDLQGEIPH
jgi:hypothetical protein